MTAANGAHEARHVISSGTSSEHPSLIIPDEYERTTWYGPASSSVK